eukprot:CAMPEP_0116927088 /NCGR_PEP_ID=MMETSP0467-20121206/25124_1 /TAXON_ID=283647 /ORGANISM="Mesodinium pulex, Strain SPMC105" /LENGTH=171 /DNA_ID=CAMNT_0004606493 /DNA_START=133 /DNA_END=648 /DNA_ORIENTATION=+
MTLFSNVLQDRVMSLDGLLDFIGSSEKNLKNIMFDAEGAADKGSAAPDAQTLASGIKANTPPEATKRYKEAKNDMTDGDDQSNLQNTPPTKSAAAAEEGKKGFDIMSLYKQLNTPISRDDNENENNTTDNDNANEYNTQNDLTRRRHGNRNRNQNSGFKSFDSKFESIAQK